MRFKPAALLGCVASGLATLVQLTSADQVPFAIDSPFTSKDVSTAHGSAGPLQPKKWTLPRESNNSAVVFDKYSLALGGGQQRLFIFAAEFHPWRLPVPSLWRDVMQKIKAAGFNTVSIYTHWGLIQPNPDPASIDLTGVNDLNFFLTMAKEEGLFVIVRPGPYINAETTVGGMAPWTVNINAVLRTNDTAWQDAWKPYIEAISRVVVKHQLLYNESKSDQLTGGSVILVQADNEYKTGKAERAYMKELVSTLKRNGISVPITYNDPGRDNNFVDLVDLYGLDSYPQRFDCSHPTTWVPFRDDYLQYHMNTNPDQPFYIPEFQGGSYDPYGGPGYEACRQMTNASFTRVANTALWSQRVTLLSLYMVYGGTNWGGLAEPDVYTSYDYGAALDEHRQTNDKYTELKRQGYFLSAFSDLAMTDQILDKPGYNITQTYDLDAKQVADAKVFRTTVLENPETKSKFYFVRYDNTTESRKIRFALDIVTLGENVTVGQWRGEKDEQVFGNNFLNARDSHIIPVDQELPGGLLLRFSTANVYRVATMANVVVISFDYGDGQMIEYSLMSQVKDMKFVSMQMFTTRNDGVTKQEEVEGEEWEVFKSMHSDLNVDPREVRASIPSLAADDVLSHQVVYETSEGTYIVIHVTPTSFTKRDFAVPARYLDSTPPPSSLHCYRKPSSLVNNFFNHSQDSVIVIKVDLLRNATYSTTSTPLDTLHLWGSLSQASDAVMMALPGLKHVYWNGEKVDARPQHPNDWLYVLPLPGPSNSALDWKPPQLKDLDWKVKDSIPEIGTDFDDTDWIKANKTHSFNPYTRDKSLDTQGTILFASEYGFHGNNILWHGHFAAPPSTSSHSEAVKDIFVKVEGGRSSAFSVWLNGVYLGSAEGDREKSAVGQTFAVPLGTLTTGGEGGRRNVVTVLQDHMGIEMEAGELPIGLQEPQNRALEAVKLPRGIVAFHFPSLRNLSVAEPKVEWKVQGNFKGEDAPDRVRRSLNEGGLHAEVQGWHLPGFDHSSWSSISTLGKEKRSQAKGKGRVVFYRASFDLNTPENTDIGLNFVFNKLHGRKFRVQLYVNGWQVGKYINNLGPQTKFLVHSGVVELRERNEVGVSVWDLDDEEGRGWDWDPRSDLKLEVNHVLSGEPRDGYVLKAHGWDELRG